MFLSYLRNYILPSITGRGLGVGLLLLCISCSNISEEERLIEVQPSQPETPDVTVMRRVLIEDFTGQRCVNCPTATQMISNLQQAYDNIKVVAVAIHSGPFAKTVRNVPYPLMTEVGDGYYNYWELDHQPVGMVNRREPSDYTDWATQVYEELGKEASLDLSLDVNYDKDSRKISINVMTVGIKGSVSGKLQVWLTEDYITAFQYMPDGSNNHEYTHNHVFRDVVNGAWGTDFQTEEGKEQSESFTYTIPEEKLWTSADPIPTNDVPKYWNAENMHVVAFVYNDSGVEQVASYPLVLYPPFYTDPIPDNTPNP